MIYEIAHSDTAPYRATGVQPCTQTVAVREDAGWPNSTVKSRGTSTVGARTLTGMFVNNGPHLAGTLTMNPDVDPAACDHMRELPYCATFMPS